MPTGTYKYRGEGQISGNLMILCNSSVKGSVVWFQWGSPLGTSQGDTLVALFPCWGFYFPLLGLGGAGRRKQKEH